VAQNLVVGILGTSDPKAIEDALKGQNVDLTRVKVVTKANPSQAHDDSVIDFLHVARAMDSNSLSDDMTHATGIMSDSGGTGVPGIGGSSQTLGQFTGGGSSKDYFGTFKIPTDEVANFNDAVDAGRSVVTYQGTDGDTSAVSAAFKAAGLKNVRSY
jgi:hypothetical protein